MERKVNLQMRGDRFGFNVDLTLYHCAAIIEYIATIPEEDRIFREPHPIKRDKAGKFLSIKER